MRSASRIVLTSSYFFLSSSVRSSYVTGVPSAISDVDGDVVDVEDCPTGAECVAVETHRRAATGNTESGSNLGLRLALVPPSDGPQRLRHARPMLVQGVPPDLYLKDFSGFARSLVYGGVQIGTSNNLKDTDYEEKEVKEDPSYEPNPEEIATADDDLHSDEDQRTVGKTSAQIVASSAIVAQKKRSIPEVAPSNIATRSMTTTEPEAGSSDEPTATAGLNTEGAPSPNQIMTSGGSTSSPEDNQIVNFERQETLTTSGGSKRKRGGRRRIMGHGLHEYTRRHGGNKMPIEFTAGVRRPKDYVQSAKLSNEVGIHIREKMPLATHWTQYKKDETLIHVIPRAISTVAGKFSMDKNDEVAQDVCTDMLQVSIRQFRYRLKKEYWPKIKNLTLEQAYLKKPDHVEEKSWKELVKRWFDEKYQGLCVINGKNREAVKQFHTTGSRSYVAHWEHLVSVMNFPIQSILLSYTVYNASSEREKPIHHLQQHIPTKIGRRNKFQEVFCLSTRIRELQQRLADQEQNSIQAAETYHSEMQARLQEQDQKFEEIRKKQEEELEAVKKAQEEKTLAYEKRLTEMDAVLNLLLRTSQPPSMSQSQGN
ncbi:hypothetical protein QYE76_035541 [Lolium multiflorum]|uniref:Transposase n=1 Tax=Lolium multiflorum TaxID=4521 RepID=A0AAD8VPB1_LOLMU|nr:hypothetical protein QYE76_035541 [Lolium multiflorum]